MIVFAKHAGPEHSVPAPGTWALTHPRFLRYRVMLCCPDGHAMGLPHSVADDGVVSPSVVCPREGCAFHEFVRLDAWDAREAQS